MTFGDSQRPSRWRPATLTLSLAWLGVIAFLTLRPAPAAAAAAAESPWWCLACGEAGTADLLLNAMLFLPLGWGIAATGGRLRAALVAGLLLSVVIEATQGLALPGRDAALGDVLANAGGAALGWWLRLIVGRPAGRRWATGASFAAFVAQLAIAPWLLRPGTVAPGARHVQLAPVRPGQPIYRGTVRSLTVAGNQLHGDSRGDAGRPATLTAAFTWASGGTVGETPIVRIEDDHGWSLVAISADDTLVAVTVRTRGGALRLRTPTWGATLPAIIGDRHSDREVALRMTSGATSLVVRAAGDSTGTRVRYGAQHAWTLLNPFMPVVMGGRGWQWWTLVWLAGWGAVLGASAARRRRALPWAIATVFALLVGTHYGGAPAVPLEVLALMVGWTVALRTARLLQSPGAA